MNKTRALERDEIHRLFGGVSGRYAQRNRTMLICGIAMALRATELVSLNVGDVIDRNGEVKTYIKIRPETAKFAKTRRIRIGEGIRESIKDFIEYKREGTESLEPDAPLFVSRQGGHITRQTLFLHLKKILGEGGIDESPHCLRKTGATAYYIQSNYDLIATQDFLGHADPSTTRKYIGLDMEQLIAYSERLSEYLLGAISGEFNTSIQMSSSLSNSDLIVELQQRGFDVTSLLQQKRTRDLKESKVISIDAVRQFS